ncbi:deoxynucleotide monophosphate kinase family protein [Arenibaculum pallidiluteum]|uniref:deoxynucleotide monophosphate kinase family protein n=1 Tax=Arenibaculum pallidiluteum TaxID=2812559 RepID=UPI001A962F23|nr:hypothetical protein [Arenibaculum pallidiluteum]
MTAPRIIAVTGLAGSGKSTVATCLARRGYRRERFAGPLKSMMHALGLTEEHTDGGLKEMPCDLLGGVTPRRAMQTLGTEWGRQLIDPNLWVRAWMQRAAEGLIVVDDCRFLNEAGGVRMLGGVAWRVERPGHHLDVGGHASEAEMHLIQADAVLRNTGTVEDLDWAVGAMLENWP